MMKLKLLMSAGALCLTMTASAGGLMTNTNYHIAFDRMMARGASMEIDAAYSNPAGLVWGYEGFQMSLDFQKPWQRRDIELGGTTYEGKASAPIVPALFASYRKDRLAVSAMIGIVGSGGFVEYSDGVPMFNVPVRTMIALSSMQAPYTLDSEMKGKQYIYGGQVNVAYRLTDWLSAAVGFRANYYDGYYKGHVVADMSGTKLVNLQLDCPQRGWGFAPIVSVDFHQGPLTVAARYEFRTKLETENDTKELKAEIMGNTPEQTAKVFGSRMAGYMDGVKTRYDMPALLAVAVGYELTPRLRATAEYHFFDDKNAKMADNRQEHLTRGTHEVQLGAEYDINDRWTVSLGGQRTDYGLSDDYQQDTSFACDSYSIGIGGAWNVTEKLRLNAGYFISLYSDYTKTSQLGQETFSRTNNVVGVGIDYKF